MPANQRSLEFSDPELLELIKEDRDYLSIVYKETKEYCFRFMRRMSSGSNVREEDLRDIYQDAVLILYEKIIADDFHLTSSFQTYLNSVCRYQLLKRFNTGENIDVDPNYRSLLNQLQFDPEVKDELKELEVVENNRFLAMEKALKLMKDAGGKCYELLSLFWYHKRSIRQLTEHFAFSSEDNTKTQKYKCQKRLRKMAHKALNAE